MPREPQKDVKASEDLLEVVFIAHTIASALSFFGMTNTYKPDSKFSLETIEDFNRHIEAFIEKYINFELPISPKERRGSTGDGVYDYAVQVLSFGLFHAEFVDAVHEGDGECVIRCWRFLLPLFKSAARVNYSKETITLLSQLLVLSPRQAHQVKWSRFVIMSCWS